MSATGADVLNKRGSVGVGADRGCDCCFDRIILGLIDWTGCWQTDDGLLVRRLITEGKDRLKVDDLIAERHSQGIGFGFEIS
jgi:hypothetical protein